VKIVRTSAELRAALAAAAPGTVGLVPTMGAFHDGHLALLGAARSECDLVVASLFVNPAQFEDDGDLAAYPRDEARDERLAREAGVDVLFAPPVEQMYPPGFQTWVEVEELGRGLEGEARPGHFRGVATVCLKLFLLVRPGRAYFGQKDAQQVAVVRRLVRDLELGVEIRVVPTVRDPDGLALSSRNVRLSPEERRRALALPRALAAGAEAHRTGGDPVAAARASLDGLAPDYVSVLELGGATVLAAAARVGPVRLIDNVLLEGELP
jgi:pantoate--beta-alanine ligase